MSDDAKNVSPRAVELVSGLTDGKLLPAERKELRELLATDRAALNWYLEWMSLHSMLHLDLATGVALPTPRLARVHRPVDDDAHEDSGWIDPEHIVSLLDEDAEFAERRAREAEEAARHEAETAARRQELYLDRSMLRTEPGPAPRGWYFAAAVAASLLVTVAWHALSTPDLVKGKLEASRHQAALPTPGRHYVGAIARSFQAKWQEPKLGVAKGDQLSPGPATLERGVVEIALLNGARLVVEAPAAFELVSPDRVNFHRGRVVANVPPEAVGFTLRAQAASFIDLGTEFGVEVTEEGAASIHVLEGEVALVKGDRDQSESSRMLQVGAAQEVSADGSEVRKIAFDAAKFLRRVPHSAYELAVLKSRPLAYWRLDKRNAPVVSGGRLELSTSFSIGVDLVEAADAPELHRGGPEGAARFGGAHDGMGVTPDEALGIVSECTYEAWVLSSGDVSGPQRIFSTFDRPRSGMAIGVVDGAWRQQPHEGLRFHLTVYGVYDCVSRTPIEPDEWVHLAATIDEVGTPSLYVNGERVERRFRTIGPAVDPLFGGETKITWSNELRTPIGHRTAGDARIGRNPPGSDGQISPECWQGLISHVAVYGRALSADEIRQHVRATQVDGSVMPLRQGINETL
ncbi:MAG TPA: LamG-like jellyroll fold domain-containing protein [Lacipirellula sp.]